MITAMAIAMLLAQAGGGGGGGGSRPAATPAGSPAAWFGPDDYPPDALRRSEEGRVAFMVDVNVSGTPTGCHIVTSSGSSALDNGTCTVLMNKGRFKPARDASGKAVASTWSSATRWAIPEPLAIDVSNGPVQQFAGTIEVSVDLEGNVTGCKSASAVPVAADPCAAYETGRQIVAPAIKDGKPVAAILTIKTDVSIRAAE
jgi:TonB family protein